MLADETTRRSELLQFVEKVAPKPDKSATPASALRHFVLLALGEAWIKTPTEKFEQKELLALAKEFAESENSPYVSEISGMGPERVGTAIFELRKAIHDIPDCPFDLPLLGRRYRLARVQAGNAAVHEPPSVKDDDLLQHFWHTALGWDRTPKWGATIYYANQAEWLLGGDHTLYSGTGELHACFALGSALARLNIEEPTLAPSTHFRTSQLKEKGGHAFVHLGSTIANAHLDQLIDTFWPERRFLFRPRRPLDKKLLDPGDPVIVDTTSSRPIKAQGGVDFGVIAFRRFHSKSHLILGGIGTHGTDMACRALCQGSVLRELFKHLGSSLPDFEALIQVDVRDGVALPTGKDPFVRLRTYGPDGNVTDQQLQPRRLPAAATSSRAAGA